MGQHVFLCANREDICHRTSMVDHNGGPKADQPQARFMPRRGRTLRFHLIVHIATTSSPHLFLIGPM